MSDQSQGEGWWVASDGKWYPPESHPDFDPEATSTPASLPDEPDDLAAGEPTAVTEATMVNEAAVPPDKPPPPDGPPPPGDETDPSDESGLPDEDNDGTGGSWFSSGKVIAIIILVLVAIGAGVFALITLNDDDNSGDEVTVTDTTSTSVSETTSTTTSSSTTSTSLSTTTTQESTTTTTEPANEGGSIDDPMPLAGAQFEWTDGGNTWDTETLGLVEVKRAQFSGDEPGTCFLVLGTVTPTAISEGAISSGFYAPSFGAIANGRYADSSFAQCDSSGAEKAGYGWIINAEVTVGTEFPFFSEIFIPGKPAVPIENIVVGQPTSNDALYFTPDTIDQIPPTG